MNATTISLGYKPRRWQQQCHAKRRRFTVLAVHRRGGKTRLALMELIDGALKSELELPLFVYIAPFLKQAKAIAWAELKRILEPLRLTDAFQLNEAELTITFKHNGASIRLFGADNADGLRGLRLDGAVIDEPAWIAAESWHDVVQPALSDRKGWALFIGTPSGINLFSELFFKAGALPDWCALRFTVDETGALDKDEVARLRRDMPDQSFAREYLCDFAASGDDQLISLSDVEVAAKRTYGERDLAGAPKILGVDPARFGNDRSVLVMRQGLQVFAPVILRGIDNMTLAARVATTIEHWRPDATFIDSGAGAGVIDRLRQLRFHPIEVPFGGKATKPHLYVNRRAEMWKELADWLRSGGAIPNDPSLKQELATPVYSYDSAGRMVLESKDEIRKRMPGAGSPDIADALALTFAAPVAARRSPYDSSWPIFRRRTEPRTEFDPYSDRVFDSFDPWRWR